MLKGINPITLSVAELERSIAFYTHVLTCKLLAKWDKGAYLMAGNIWLCLALDPHVRLPSPSAYSHIAFDISEKDFPVFSAHICRFGAPIWKENTSEGNSLYFLDPDGHKLEIHATSVHDRIAACRKNPYSGMVFFDEKETA